MAVWRKQTVKYRLNGRTVPKGTPRAKKSKILSRRYYGTLRTAAGKSKQQVLCEDRRSAEILLRRLQSDEDRKQAIGEDGYGVACKTPLSDHIRDYRHHLTAKGDTENYVSLCVGRVTRVLEAIHAKAIMDLEPSKITSHLLTLRSRKKKPISFETSNHYTRALKGFSKWLWTERRTREDLLRSIRVINADGQRKRLRRALTTKELTRLISATRSNDTTLRGETWVFAPEDRATLYLLAAYTGLRASEIASLSMASFDLGQGVLTVEAAYSKRRRKDTLPIHPSLIQHLAAWLEGKGRGRLFPGSWNKHYKAAKLLRHDLESAGIAYVDDQGRYVDFHALRHTFISSLARSGVKPVVAKELARHSTITLTMDVYSHVETEELRDALGQLPGIGE